MPQETLSAADLFALYGAANVAQMRCAPGRDLRFTAGGWLTLSGEPNPWLNYAHIANGPEGVTLVRAYTEVIDRLQTPTLVFFPDALDPCIERAALEAGWHYVMPGPLMVYQATGRPFVNRRYQGERVDTVMQLREVRHLIVGAYEIAPESIDAMFTEEMLKAAGLACFLARHDGVAMSTVTTVQSGSVAGVFFVGTPPEHQRKGAGRAAMEAAIAWNVARGVKTFYLGATAAGFPLYTQIGFTTLLEIPVWVAGAPADEAH